MLLFFILETLSGKTIAQYQRIQANFETVRLTSENDYPLQLPLRCPHPARILQSPIVRHKAHAVLHMIEDKLNLSSVITSSGSEIEKPFLQLMKLLFERPFDPDEKMVKKLLVFSKRLSPSSIAPILDYYVEHAGLFKLELECSYSRKKNTAEIECTNTARKMDSMLTVFIQENAAEYIYQTDPSESQIVFECHSKLRKRKFAEVDLNSPDFEVDFVDDVDDLHFCPVKYFLIDPFLTTIRNITYTQPCAMSIYQIFHSHSLIAQLDGVAALARYTESKSIIALSLCLQNETFFYKVRSLAAAILALNSSAPASINSEILVKFWQGKYHVPAGNYELPKANDWSNVEDYLLKKDLIGILSSTRDVDGYTPDLIVDLLIDIAMKNDNSLNKFSDVIYRSSLVLSLGRCKVKQKDKLDKIIFQLHRYYMLDKMFPSRNQVTCSVLRGFTDLILSGHNAYLINSSDKVIDAAIKVMHDNFDEGNDYVKIASLQCLVCCFTCNLFI